MRILGIDICKGSVIACLLTERPNEPRQFLFKTEFFNCKADVVGLKTLLDLKPDIAVMEPTGVNYSKLWGTHLARSGCRVMLVSHNKLARHREHLDMPDKSDESDAFALACYWWDYHDQPRRFLQDRDQVSAKIREKVLRLGHLARCQSPIINRIRQDLAWQFPEVAMSQGVVMWEWLALERESKKYDRLLANSVGLGIELATHRHAKRLIDIWGEEKEIEAELEELMTDSRFISYRQVFNKWGFGRRVQAILLSQIFPIESFLDDDNNPIIQWGKSRKNKNKRTKRHISLRRFTKALGCAPTEKSSGDKESKRIVGGSDICRVALWQWLFTRIEVFRNRPKNDVGNTIGKIVDDMKEGGRPVKLIRMTAVAKATKLLFKDLVDMVK
ncbi:transposase [Pseudanabaena sp. 'Roaring Creek']|uniref:IS110 family transposase n=1 Tax=Pseudanabaena sp. 'Roaring Creek' TaxID=1681830 RepID=UPI0006D7A3EB|nr:transposase [Pseudanabaena sp. 'Roaring Creek']